MDNEYTLSQQAFLLCYNLDKQRMTRTDHIDYLVRAATLIELFHNGLIEDKNGKVVPARNASTTDPVLAAVLDEIGQAPTKSWKHWVRRNAKPTKQAVRAALVDRRAVAVEQGRVLLVFPHTFTTVKDTRAVKHVRAKVKDALRQPIAQVDPSGAALVALAAAVEMGFVLDHRTRREYKARIKQCMELAGPAAAGLRKLIQQRRSGAIAGATAGAGAASGS
jgi:Golgi phosphoprotein 3 (GPP34)